MSAPAKTHSPEAPRPIPPAEHVRRLVEANRVEEARQYVEERRASGDATVEGWARVLRPPHVRSSPGSARAAALGGRGPDAARADFGADYAWLRENREAFLGHWVALSDGTLLDSDVALQPLVERLRACGKLVGAFVVQVD